MKNLVKITLALLILGSIVQINAFEASSTNVQTNAISNVFQNILLDGNQQSFIAPHDGTYEISFNANAVNQSNNPASVAIKAYVNDIASNTVTISVQVPGAQQMPIHFAAPLELKENDTVQFRWSGTRSSVNLQPINNQPSFDVTINPAKPTVKL